MSERCDRFAREEWTGEDDLDEEARAHVASCADCREELAYAGRLAADLARVGEHHRLRDGAREELWKAIERKDEPKPRARRNWGAAVAAGLALAASVALFFFNPPEDEPRLAYEVIAAGEVVRGSNEHSLGDVLRARASTEQSAHIELRLYRERTNLIVRCPGDSACSFDDGVLRLEHRFESTGRYELLLLSSERPISIEPRSIDDDAAAITAISGTYELREVEVR